ncbi:MAG: NAD(P)H-quinone oxidoreductase [Polyangiales bacterium]
MESVRAVRIRGSGGPEVLELGEVACRAPGHGEVLVSVAAAGLNRADLMQRRGLYPAPAGYPPDVPGLEFAGTVARVGAGVAGFAPGDRVMGITGGGAMSEALVAHHRELLPVPEGMPLEEAAAIPEAFLTAWDALFGQAGVGLGDVALVHAAASGVGTAAVQLCRAAGVRSIGTSRSASKLAAVKALGLDEAVVPGEAGFADAVLALTGGRGVDATLDPVGARYLADNLRALAPLGRLVLIGLMGGAAAEVPLGLLLTRRLRVMGTVLRSRPHEEKAALAQAFARAVLPLFARGALRPVVDAVRPMAEVRAAHERMERNDTTGKIVLRW